jgi:hypothetical protein
MLRREEVLAIGRHRAMVLSRLNEMYSNFDHLPAICKYANLIRCVRAYV